MKLMPALKKIIKVKKEYKNKDNVYLVLSEILDHDEAVLYGYKDSLEKEIAIFKKLGFKVKTKTGIVNCERIECGCSYGKNGKKCPDAEEEQVYTLRIP